MTIKIIIEEYYNLICEMNYLLILSNGTLEDSENIQSSHKRLSDDNFIKEIMEYLISNDGYNHQLELYKEHNFQGDSGLNQIKLLRKNK